MFTFMRQASADGDFLNVVLLLRFNGSNGGTSFVDSSRYVKTMTAGGNAQTSAVGQKFGSACGLFDGSGDMVSTPTSADFDVGAGDFCVETWVYPLATTQQRIVVRSTLGGVYPFSLAISAAGKFSFFCCDGSAAIVTLAATTSVTTGRWWHVAGTRSGNTFRLFIDGVEEATSTSAASLVSNGIDLSVGAYRNGSEGFNGRLDDLRITKGAARYTANFTPPTAEFADS